MSPHASLLFLVVRVTLGSVKAVQHDSCEAPYGFFVTTVSVLADYIRVGLYPQVM